MKKGITLVLVLVICMNLVGTAFAAAFTESVESKGAPEVVEIQNAEGNAAIAVISGLPEGVRFVSNELLVVTAVADAQNSDRIPDASEHMLLKVYNGLRDGSIQVPFAELDREKADSLVIRDLFDVSWADVEDNNLKTYLENEGTALEMTFAMAVAADVKVYVMVYKNDAWQQIRQVVNNGDGTITCVFEHLCPVAVIVETEKTGTGMRQLAETDGTAEPAEGNLGLWTGILAVSALALAAVLTGRKKSKEINQKELE